MQDPPTWIGGPPTDAKTASVGGVPPLWDRRAWILRKLAAECYTHRPEGFTLSHRGVSDHYLDVRRLTLDPEGLCLVVADISLILGEGITHVGGPTVGADPIVAGLVLWNQVIWSRPIKGFLVRKEAKGHGLGGQFVGHTPGPGDKILLVEDVLTTGASLQGAIDAVRATGAAVTQVIVVCDRQVGGAERVQDQGLSLEALTRLEEVIACHRLLNDPGT